MDKTDREIATDILEDIVQRYNITPGIARELISHLKWLLKG